MPALLLFDRGEWSRHELPRAAGYAVVQPEAGSPVILAQGHVARISPAAVGVILICEDGQPYHLSAPDATTYLNADQHPILPVHRLRHRDRMTCYRPDGSSLRFWYLHDSLASHRYEGAPLGQACGYCSIAFTLGEEIVTCAACAETLHADCLAHGGGKCPRCGTALAPDEAPWFPEGFTDPEEDADDWE
jgi:hypothetical protein